MHLLLADGFAYDIEGTISIEPQKYFNNLQNMWYVAVILLMGVALVLYGIIRTFRQKTYLGGIWLAGTGTIFVIMSLLLCAGWNNTSYYPSVADLQSSLTIANSCSSEFTLHTMAIVSLFMPFVVAYIAYAWYSIDKRKIDADEISQGNAY